MPSDSKGVKHVAARWAVVASALTSVATPASPHRQAATAPGPKVPTGRFGLSLRALRPGATRVSGITAGLAARSDKVAALLAQRGTARLYVALPLE